MRNIVNDINYGDVRTCISYLLVFYADDNQTVQFEYISPQLSLKFVKFFPLDSSASVLSCGQINQSRFDLALKRHGNGGSWRGNLICESNIRWLGLIDQRQEGHNRTANMFTLRMVSFFVNFITIYFEKQNEIHFNLYYKYLKTYIVCYAYKRIIEYKTGLYVILKEVIWPLYSLKTNPKDSNMNVSYKYFTPPEHH